MDNHKKILERTSGLEVEITVRVGRTKMLIKDILRLGQGSTIILEKIVDEDLEIYINDRLVGRGKVITIGDNYGIKITEFIKWKQPTTSDPKIVKAKKDDSSTGET